MVVETVRLNPSNSVSAGDRVDGHLSASTAMAAVYTTEVSDDQDALRLDISNTFADLDLFIYQGDMEDNAVLGAETLRSTEQAVLTRDGSPALVSGTYYILVIDQISADHPVDFTLNVSDSADPPSYLGRVPVIPRPSDPFQRALVATVEVVTENSGGGSGCLLTADGYLVTNWHVVAGADDQPDPYVTVALSLDHTIPPTELFHVDVVAFDEELDLALLHITGDRYGRPLRRALNLPHFEIQPELVSIGDELLFIGYPWVGGTGSRSSVTLTRGIVAGYQHNEFGTSFKTDGEINSGNSGGAAIDSQYRLVGIPSSVVGEDAGQLAYVIPIGVMPEVWLDIMGLND
jgi:S1-C subfamily serine protease